MEENGFSELPTKRTTAADLLASKNAAQHLLSVEPDDPLLAAIELMRDQGVSQLPVLQDGEVIGAITERATAKALHDALEPGLLSVRHAMGRRLPEVDAGTEVSEVYRLLLSGHPGVVVVKQGHLKGFLSRMDLICYWARKNEAGGETFAERKTA